MKIQGLGDALMRQESLKCFQNQLCRDRCLEMKPDLNQSLLFLPKMIQALAAKSKNILRESTEKCR